MMSWLTEHASAVTVFGAIITALGAIVAGLGGYLSSNRQANEQAKIAELNQSIAASVTGGNNYPAVFLLRSDETKKWRLMVGNEA